MTHRDWTDYPASSWNVMSNAEAHAWHTKDAARFVELARAAERLSLRASFPRWPQEEIDRTAELWLSDTLAKIAGHERTLKLERIGLAREEAEEPIYQHLCETDPQSLEAVLDDPTLMRDAPLPIACFRGPSAAPYFDIVANVPGLDALTIGRVSFVAKNARQLIVRVWPYVFPVTEGHDLSQAQPTVERIAQHVATIYGGKNKPGVDLCGVTEGQGRDLLEAYTRLDYETEKPTRMKVSAMLEKHNGKPPDRKTVMGRVRAMMKSTYWQREIASYEKAGKFSKGFFR